MFVPGNILEIKYFENIESIGYGLNHYSVIYSLSFDLSSICAKYTMPLYAMS